MIHKVGRLINYVTSLGGYASHGLTRFLRYGFSGTLTFALDFFLLLVLTDYFGIYYLLSAAISFSSAISVQYLANRYWTYRGTTRHIVWGYAYFLLIALTGLLLTIFLMRFFVEDFGLNYLIARVVVAILVGLWNYGMNTHLTFNK